MLNHLPLERLADLAEGRLPADDRAHALSHLSDCRRCSAKLSSLEKVVALMRTDEGEDAPAAVLAGAVSLFRRRAAAAEPSLARRLVAALTFDSLSMTPAYGVRSGAGAARQLLFSAGENDVDLRVSASGDEWVVSGQLLGRDCAGGRVELEGSSGKAGVSLDAQCEFTLPPVPAGVYNLTLSFAGVEVVVPEVELGHE